LIKPLSDVGLVLIAASIEGSARLFRVPSAVIRKRGVIEYRYCCAEMLAVDKPKDDLAKNEVVALILRVTSNIHVNPLLIVN
jgi:hypothetical protein